MCDIPGREVIGVDVSRLVSVKSRLPLERVTRFSSVTLVSLNVYSNETGEDAPSVFLQKRIKLGLKALVPPERGFERSAKRIEWSTVRLEERP